MCFCYFISHVCECEFAFINNLYKMNTGVAFMLQADLNLPIQLVEGHVGKIVLFNMLWLVYVFHIPYAMVMLR